MLSEAGIIVINPVPDEQLLAERMVPDRGVTPRWKAVRRRRNPLSAGTLHADYRAAPISRRAWPVRPVGCAESAPADVRVAKEILMIGKLQPKLAKAGIGMTDAEAPTTARAA